MDRIIQMASKVGDVVFDPFGGAGTTYLVSELKQTR
jgi:site-specific DNA-methyltransferase (adenine-specific)